MKMIEKSKASRTMQATKPLSFSQATSDPLNVALKLSVPAWPLQNVVAVNPFWNLKDKNFLQVMSDLAPILHTQLYMPLPYYLAKYRDSLISEVALEEALTSAKARQSSSPASVAALLQVSTSAGDVVRGVLSFAEYYEQISGGSYAKLSLDEASKYCAAYFDNGQSYAGFPWQDGSGFWATWIEAQDIDLSMELAGVDGFRKCLTEFSGSSARDFIISATTRLGLETQEAKSAYYSRLIARYFGWSTHFSYVEWQTSLGYSMRKPAQIEELLAVCLAYDYAIASFACKDRPEVVREWAQTIQTCQSSASMEPANSNLNHIWQSALELTYQSRTAAMISPTRVERSASRFQIVTCIDVRSEMLRRALEQSSSEIDTIGFAGFFGMPFDYQKLDERTAHHRLPVLLKSAFTVREHAADSDVKKVTNYSAFQAYFRNLRKAPIASFLYVEVFGFLAVTKIFFALVNSLKARSLSPPLPKRFDDTLRSPSQEGVVLASGEAFDLRAKGERAAGVLRHMGLTKHFGRIVVIAGHGSATTNNAFASALDCGACGGHGGDINARFLADLLNDAEIRRELGGHGIELSEHTCFVAAVHETVTDELYLLDEHKVPASHHADLQRLKTLMLMGSQAARQERQTARSIYLDREVGRRSRNWSEVRPEWGLAGNACFIIAPRQWTKNACLSSRSFLHDYDWRQDKGFATLELIMTAPMVVTNWINMQYYASTVAPAIYGAGSKTLHNLVNECGVLEGNGGGLRVGLPIQSVHDGDKFTHEPLRLTVFIAAPRAEIEAIISRHPTVKALVDNQWLHLLHIDEDKQSIQRRLPGGIYKAL